MAKLGCTYPWQTGWKVKVRRGGAGFLWGVGSGVCEEPVRLSWRRGRKMGLLTGLVVSEDGASPL